MPSPNLANMDTKMSDDAPKYEDAFPPLPQSQSTAKTPLMKSSSHVPKPMLPFKQSVTTQMMVIPLEERRFQSTGDTQFGGKQQDAQRKICQDISLKTMVKIDLTSTKDRSLTLVISGKPENVLNARRLLTKELQTQAQKQLPVAREYHRFILGKAGSKLKQIELSSSTKINIPRYEEGADTVTIIGTKEGIDLACRDITAIVDEQSKLAYERLTVPKIYHPFICGPYNKTIIDLRERTKARINLPPPTVEGDDITVSGEKTGVLSAVSFIKKIYEEKQRKCTSIEIDVKKAQHKYIIGPRGSGLSEILETTGVSVEVPPSDSDSLKIRLRGTSEQLGMALTKVYEKAGSMTSETIPAVGWLHRFIIGKQGTTLNKIIEGRDKVRVECSESTDCIEVEGPAEDVDHVVKHLRAKVHELEKSMARSEVRVDPKYHKHIVGKSGSNIARLQNENQVSIRIPNDSNNWTVTIVGDPSGVDRVKEEIHTLVNKMDNEKQKDVVIEHQYHRMLIGSNGVRIKELRDRYPQVTIVFPDSKASSDLVSVRGPRQSVDSVASQLHKLYQSLMESNYQREVRVFKQFHKNIIGKGGATIRSIREETSTKIDLPDERAESDVIRITGKKKDVDEAVKRVEAIQKELANIKELIVEIPARLHTALIGSKGRLIRAIQDECGDVQINFPDSEKHSDRIVIRGPIDDAEKAKKQLLDLAQEKQEFSHQDSVHAKPEFHKFLIGKRGGHIEQIRKSTGALIIFPDRDDEDKDMIQIIGSVDSVKKAKQELEDRIKAMENVVEEVVSIDSKWHRHFLIRRGQKLEELARDFGGVNISFPKQNTPIPEGDQVRIKGPRDCVEAASRRMQEIVSDLAAQIVMEVDIPQTHHRALIGRNGEQVRDIQNDFDVQIKFPNPRAFASQQSKSSDDHTEENSMPSLNGEVVTTNGDHDQNEPANTPEHQESIPPMTNGDQHAEGEAEDARKPCDIITITGKQENCQAAKEALLLMVPISEEVELANEFHRSLIGQRGQGVQEFQRRFNIQINIPDASKNSDSVIAKGTKARIDQFRAALVESLVRWEEEKLDRIARSFSVELDVPVQYHRVIIGQRGATINEIRDKFGVNIEIPNANNSPAHNNGSEGGEAAHGNGSDNEESEESAYNPERIVIRGYQDKAEAARDDIQALITKLQSYAREEIVIPNEVHSRLIGGRGRSLRQMITDFSVEITFPSRDAEGDAANVVLVVGEPDNVDRACDHLITRANEMMEEIEEREETYGPSKPSHFEEGRGGGGHNKKPKSGPGYVVSGAPWAAPDTSSTLDFPSIGGGPCEGAPAKSAGSSWGAGRRP